MTGKTTAIGTAGGDGIERGKTNVRACTDGVGVEVALDNGSKLGEPSFNASVASRCPI
jgi:hypothetical protein